MRWYSYEFLEGLFLAYLDVYLGGHWIIDHSFDLIYLDIVANIGGGSVVHEGGDKLVWIHLDMGGVSCKEAFEFFLS